MAKSILEFVEVTKIFIRIKWRQKMSTLGNKLKTVGQSHLRIDGMEKVMGAAKFTHDYTAPGLLYARIATSPYAHAVIKSIDYAKALELPSTKAVITGEHFPFLTGSLLKDRPILAVNKVRYHGEPIAIVVATSECEAEQALEAIQIEYEPLPVINTVYDALKDDAVLVHENLGSYEVVKPAKPEPNTNVAHRSKIRKGNMEKGWDESDVVIEGTFSYPKSDHAALEIRAVRAKTSPDGGVTIYSSTQAPFVVQKLISRYFNVDAGKVVVHTPYVGGSFGGRATVWHEFLAYIAAKAVDGKEVKLVLTREEDMISAPCHIGLEAKVKLGCTKDGLIKAAEFTYLFDGGAYTDQGLAMSKAAAADCSGPYNIENIWCDSLCVYTNRPWSTSFRGFGHSELTFAVERAMDLLAKKLNMDPFELRLKNAIKTGHLTPSQTVLTEHNIGDLSKCIIRLKELIHWEEGQVTPISPTKVRAKGIGCLWKTPTSPPNATSGAIVTFNHDGSMTLNIGAVELGQGTKTVLAQILAERMKMDVNKVHVTMEVNTMVSPEHWKTVASTATFMVGNAVLEAADDAIQQIKEIAAAVLRTTPKQLEVGNGKVFLKYKPSIYIDIYDITMGFKYREGNAIGGQVIGRGTYIMHHLLPLDPNTGKGVPSPTWTVGAQAVEAEFDTVEFTYKIVKAVAVMDAGRIINPKMASGVTMGGMSMGLATASREGFAFDENGIVQNPNFRSYKLMRFNDAPEYIVEFVETPQIDGPFGARALGEHGLLGIPGALANCLSAAAGVELNQLPLTPERIWRAKHDFI